MKSQDITVVYIMGYGRSGSTFLDILLSNLDGAVSVGAVSNLFDWMRNGESCACGEELADCPQWGPIVRRYLEELSPKTPEQLRQTQYKVERRRHLGRLFSGRLDDGLLREYTRSQELIYQEVAEQTGQRLIVDSSNNGEESAGRTYSLWRHTALNVKILHLVRDGRGVAWSSMRGPGSPERKRWPLPRPLRATKAILAWGIANAIGFATVRRVSDEVLLVRYEDIVSDPAGELRRIGRFLGKDPTRVIDAVRTGDELPVGHQVGGNRVRFNQSIRLNPDFEWQRRMPRIYRGALTALGWPVLRRLGYTGPGQNG